MHSQGFSVQHSYLRLNQSCLQNHNYHSRWYILPEELEKYIKEKEELEKKSYEMDILGEMDILEDEYSSEDALLHRPGVRFEDDEEGNDND